MQKQLSEFGLRLKYKKVENIQLKHDIQSEIFDFEKMFACPISDTVYNNVYTHNKECRYLYCKNGWKW